MAASRTSPSALQTTLFLSLFVWFILASCAQAQTGTKWKVHDLDRPAPPVIDPGQPGHAPSDALVLFDGSGLSQWTGEDGGAPEWKVTREYLEVAGKKGITTKAALGDMQLHIEFATPVPATGESQGRGNSGIIFMGLYEVQVLDSYQNRTYADGQAAAVYGQHPPFVNASRPPGEWQTYDIVFHAPRFDAGGTLLRPARVTVLHNGVLVQDNFEITGPTADGSPYKAHSAKLPLTLQNHHNPVRYRNLWLRELKDDE